MRNGCVAAGPAIDIEFAAALNLRSRARSTLRKINDAALSLLDETMPAQVIVEGWPILEHDDRGGLVVGAFEELANPLRQGGKAPIFV